MDKEDFYQGLYDIVEQMDPNHGAILTIADFVEHHSDMRTRIPTGSFLGPLMVLGHVKHPRLYKPLSRLAFWLLRFVGWKLASSYEDYKWVS